MKKYKSLSGRIIAEIITTSNKTESGLYKIDNSMPLKAIALSVGSKCEKVNPPCEAGDIIYFTKYGAKSVENKVGYKSQTSGICCIYFKDVIAKERA